MMDAKINMANVLKVVSLSDTLSHDPFAERKQRVETTRATPNLTPRRAEEEPRHTPCERSPMKGPYLHRNDINTVTVK